MLILLTGGNGMVGRNLLEHSSISKFRVLAPSSSQLDLRNFKNLIKYLEKHKPNLIIHAAGKVGGIQANIKEPVNFFLDNLDIGRNIIWASRKVGITKLINLGSSCMYPRSYKTPLTEDLILKGELEPTNESYALAKIVVARLCQYINKENSNFHYKTLIPCNLYGRYDNFNPGYSHLIPSIIEKIHKAKIKKKKNVIIWGNGIARREFMYAGDFSDALINAIKKFNTLPDTMNIGVGYDYTISNYYYAAAKVIGYNGNFTHDLQKPIGMKRKLVSLALQKKWGWNAKTDIHTGIANAYQYYLESILK